MTSRYCSLPTPPLIPPALGGHATCHCWRWAKCRLSGSWGHDVQGVWLVSCGAPTNGAEECRLIRRTAVSSQTSKSTDGWKLLEQGPKSQATSKTCSVGPSSLIDASDLVGLNLVSGHAYGNQPYRSLPFRGESNDSGNGMTGSGWRGDPHNPEARSCHCDTE